MALLLMQILSYALLSGLDLAAGGPSTGLKWVRVNVPQYRVPGESAIMECDFDIGNDSLYAVKWYKEHEEFYRYVPKAKPQKISYKVEGLHVDMSKSDSKRVVLHSVSWKTSGLFRCEVSAEAPSFSSAQSEARMEVVFLPQEDPVITGVEMQYQIGDEINLNCTSGKSHPAPILHWYINEQQGLNGRTDDRYYFNCGQSEFRPIITLDQINGEPNPLPSSPSFEGPCLVDPWFEVRAEQPTLQGGSMRVKCVASIAPILYRSDKESVVQTPSQSIKDMREALLLVKSSASESTLQGKIPILLISLFIWMSE